MTEIATNKKDWKEARTVRLLVTSATQIETFLLCKRKWWLKKVRRLEDPTTKSQAFGTVLHSVNERYLRADALGRDEKGNLVDLYPPGWTKAVKRHPQDEDDHDGEVSPAEASVIKTLVAEAINSGILERIEERVIEHEFREDVVTMPCPDCHGGSHWPKGEPCDVCGVPFGGDHDMARHEAEADRLACDEGEDPDLCKVTLDPPPWVCPTCGGDGKGDRIQVVGYIDYLTPDGVQDHKTTSSMRWAKSKESLRTNAQMLIYAKVLLNMHREAHAKDPAHVIPDKFSLRHNVFCKDPNDLRVRKTEVYVTPEEVDAFWANLEEVVREMSIVRRTANGWHEAPEPKSFAHACNAYGGCPFKSICAGKESEEMYEKRIDRQQQIKYISGSTSDNLLAAVSATYQEQLAQESRKMSLADIMKQRQALNAAANGAAVASPINPPAAAAATAPISSAAPATGPASASLPAPQSSAPAPASGEVAPPPWANPACTACKGLGFNTQGAPCRICDVAATRGKPPKLQSANYTLQPVENGEVIWQLKDNPDVFGVSRMFAGNGQVKSTVVEQRPAPAVEQVPVQPVQAHAPEQTPAAALAQGNPATATAAAAAIAGKAEKEETRGRPKKGFTLVLNGNVTKGGGRNVTRLGDKFVELKADLAKASNVGDYYELDSFRRRDAVSSIGEKIAEEFGTDIVCADVANGSPDFKALVEAIRPYASVEIVCG